MKLNKNFEHNIKNIVIMGGNKDGIGNITTTAEFNFFADPEAAQVVFKRLENLDEVKATLVTWELCKDSYFSWVNITSSISGHLGPVL
jgi:inosine-uridine nucleoside N-ribohydrolase